MRLHFADSAHERGQYAALRQEGCESSLLSYHYAKAPGIMRGFEGLWASWEDPVNLHYVGTGPPEVLRGALGGEGTEKHLLSYAMKRDEAAIYGPLWEGAAGKARVLIDSGAFTAYSSGKPIRPEEYGRWALEFTARWRHRLAFLAFMNLDVIGDQVASWRNQEALERMGLSPIPIITHGAALTHLTHALERYDYVALGGLVGKGRAEQERWLDRLFREVMRFRKPDGGLPKIHLLGLTTKWACRRYPIYSCDSSSWTAPLRFGGGKAAGFAGAVPRYKDGPAQRAAAMHALRHEIRRFKDLETETTALWRSRGVTWDGA